MTELEELDERIALLTAERSAHLQKADEAYKVVSEASQVYQQARQKLNDVDAFLRQERRRREDLISQDGSPGLSSVSAVLGDPAYQQVAHYGGDTWPASMRVVVRHVRTGRLWSTGYAIREDDSDAGDPTGWAEVVEKTVTRTVYEEVRR